MFGHMKDPVEGTATLVSYLEYPGAVGGKNDMVLRSQLVVQGPGLEPTAVEAVHSVFKVKVDRAKPKRLEFLDDGPDPEQYRQAGMAAAEELAARMREQQGGA